MSSTPNIRNPNHCDEYCARGHYSQDKGWTPHRAGNVRYCEHMRIWLCVGNVQGNMWTATGVWRRLSWWWDPFTHHWAKKQLEARR
jgi:hypothetical protein